MPAQNNRGSKPQHTRKNNNNKNKNHDQPLDWSRKKSAIPITKFAKEDYQYKRKLQKIEQEKQERRLLDYKRKRLLSKSGYLKKKNEQNDDDDTPLPQFLTVSAFCFVLFDVCLELFLRAFLTCDIAVFRNLTLFIC